MRLLSLMSPMAGLFALSCFGCQSGSGGGPSSDAAADVLPEGGSGAQGGQGSSSDSAQSDADGCSGACIQNGVCYAIDDRHCGFGTTCLDCTATGESCLFSPGVEGPECTCLCTPNPPVHPPHG